jgi:indole-3-glycerol phosphate synthase
MSSAVAVTGTILDRILARTAEDVAIRKGRTSVRALRERSLSLPAPLSLARTLSQSVPAVIAEIKRGSPSRGVFPVQVEPADVALAYLEGGAAALSVLTDEPFFGGSLADLEAVASVAHSYQRPAPVLRKDFVLDAFQVAEARAHGADAILLIVAALTDDLLQSLFEEATELGLDVLVEVHDEHEVERALNLGATVIGVNNRDLRTFNVDLRTTERIARMVPPDVVLVSESGIGKREDVERVRDAGAQAVLVGESLILSANRSAAVAALLPDR